MKGTIKTALALLRTVSEVRLSELRLPQGKKEAEASVSAPAFTEFSSLGVRRPSLDRFVNLLSDLSRILDLRDDPVVGLVLQPDYKGFVSVTAQLVKANPRHVYTRYPPSPPHRPLDVRICLCAYYVI